MRVMIPPSTTTVRPASTPSRSSGRTFTFVITTGAVGGRWLTARASGQLIVRRTAMPRRERFELGMVRIGPRA